MADKKLPPPLKSLGKTKQVVFSSANLSSEQMEKAGLAPNAEGIMENLGKSNTDILSYVLKDKDKNAKHTPRLAFTENPDSYATYAGIFKHNEYLIPNFLKKQIRTQDHLIASIIRNRSNQISAYGHIRKNRFDVGVNIAVKPEFESVIKPEQMDVIQKRINRAEKLLLTCGSEFGLESKEKMSLPEFFYTQVNDGVSIGWFGTEIVYSMVNGKKVFNRFRPVDSGTIYFTARDADRQGEALRRQSIQALKDLKGKGFDFKIDFEQLESNEKHYSYVQVISGTPKQAFTSEELIMTNLYPSNDILFNGYPVSPIDTAITQITTHLSIDAYNRLYFQNGRAAKGMLVLRSDDVDQNVLESIKQQFFASINSVTNAFRVPIFGVGTKDDVSWEPMVANSTDGEFQYLSDNVSRCILASFGMSPDEIAAFGYLSKGTGQQALSESSNEYKLTQSRDQSLRPLTLQFQHFLSNKILPLIDPELAQLCTVEMSGLDAQSKDQESTGLIQNSPTYYDMNSILKEVEKDTLPKHLGADVLFNERWGVVTDKFVSAGEMMSGFVDNPSAQLDPLFNYRRDPFYQSNIVQVMLAAAPERIKALYVSKPFVLEQLKMLIQDELEDEYSDHTESPQNDSQEQEDEESK